MDETRIVNKAIEESFKIAKEFLGKITDPGLRQLGGIIDDKILFWRFKNQVNLLIKAKDFLESKGISPQNVPLKILVPLLDNGSLEENENIVDKWVALLANAANPNYKEKIRPCYIEMLKELSPIEVKLLDDLYKKSIVYIEDKNRNYIEVKLDIITFLNISETDYDLIIDNLFRLNILYSPLKVSGGTTWGSMTLSTKDRIRDEVFLTPLGFSFIKACKVSK